MVVGGQLSKPGIAAGNVYILKAEWWALNRPAVAFFGSLLLLSSVFVATPWKEMSYGKIDGYDEVVASQAVVLHHRD
jgi:hypothetical protein